MITKISDNIVNLYKQNHQYIKDIIALADTTTAIYADFGQHAAIAYVATKDKKYLDKAVPKLLAAIRVDPQPNVNDIREYFAELAMLYGMIRADLTPAQDADFKASLNRWAEITCAINTQKYYGGFNYGDSDATSGYYLGLILLDQITGSEWTKRPEVIKAREALREYAREAKGGMWIESSAYNLGTLQFVLMGCYAAGIENFPEIEELVPDFAKWQLLSLTPDLKQSYQWSDDEHPRELITHRRLGLLNILYGLTGNQEFKSVIETLLANEKRTFKTYANLAWRSIYFVKPEAPKPPVDMYLKVAEGNGHFAYKRDNVAFYVHSPKRLGVHHEVSYTADMQLYLDGEWVLTKPIGYGLPAVAAEAANAPVFAGMSSMFDRGPVSWKETDDGFEVVAGTKGNFYDLSLKPYRPPVSFVEDFTRKITFIFPGKIVVADSFKGNRPVDPENFRTLTVAQQDYIKNGSLWQQVWHCNEKPVETPTGFTWKTAKGKTVTLTGPVNTSKVIFEEKVLWPNSTSNFRATELKWQVRFTSNDPVCNMTTTYQVS